MDGLRLSLAIALPGLLGVVWLRSAWPAGVRGAWPATLGYGYVAGMLATTLLLRGMDAAGLPLAFGPAAAALAGLTGLGAWVTRGARRQGGVPDGENRAPAWERAVFLLLVGALGLRLGLLACEALTSPLQGWDAWATWAPKARVWFELRRLAPFVEGGEWLQLKAAGAYTLAAAHYPPAIPLLEAWVALALGRFDDSTIGLPWVFCAAALGLAFYGQARFWGAPSLAAMTFTYLLLSLPILDTQVALPGSADLWMAAVYGLAAFSFFHWLEGDRRQGALALGLALACVLVKVPGVVWAVTFVPAFLVARGRGALLARLAFAALLSLGAVLALGGFEARLPLVGQLVLTRETLALPYLGRYALGFRPGVLRAFLESAFALASWHLLFYLLLGIALTRVRVFLADPSFRPMAILALAGFGFLGGVYTLSPLAEFALDYTQLNRALLHMVPMLVFVAMAVWVGRGERESGRPPDTLPAANRIKV